MFLVAKHLIENGEPGKLDRQLDTERNRQVRLCRSALQVVAVSRRSARKRRASQLAKFLGCHPSDVTRALKKVNRLGQV